ncbi:hypothetical protein ASPZODRAFT_105929 [Penicilliopsis zonata CBS 506.65]|uniref:Peptide N-acetyl-beta-D-glucosaminyl asparaginase amidase A N-terminal domain-containing protein n=1 Tax=Penicilliopsis zonata CBS 506.65 TaxID=1073090 RepID=A0A1L9S4B2_9EURO|nr:hypothetical protein ASPZODRAFT_105929 [Penicilliopsis zonata CBS 506.65]OJJ42010.1 hypothetical protein ASPZODRAFT_105929 [Penicilliopsis zonata CBS 506.65]
MSCIMALFFLLGSVVLQACLARCDDGLLHDFQVHPPVLTPSSTGKNEYGCVVTQTLMEYDFANSYGSPYIGEYSPPNCDFNRVVINFTLTSKGRQYDRLALMYFNSTEVWRTSTAEPTADGIIYSYTKEMQQYLSLWREPQKLIFDLGNIVDSVYTGILNTTLTATFFTVPETTATTPADTILPISMLVGGQNKSSVALLPTDSLAVSYTLPRNMKRAVISISACGQSDEEMWYQNVFSNAVDTFESVSGALLGDGPWREIQVWIDGMLAGVSWPFPVVFTGGIVPGLWKPLAGIDAFDLREHEIDITPFVPYLSDGKSHEFRITAVGVNNEGSHSTILNTTTTSWYVTGKVFIYLDEDNHITTGSMPSVSAPDPVLETTQHIWTNGSGYNETLLETTTARRSLFISSTIKTATGKEEEVSWSQEISYTNYNQLSNYGWYQTTIQNTIGLDKTGASIGYSNAYEYPINCNWTYAENGTAEALWSNTTRGLEFTITGPSVFPDGLQPYQLVSSPAGSGKIALSVLGNVVSGSTLKTTQSGTAYYFNTDPSTTAPLYNFGSSNQTMEFQAVWEDRGEVYSRIVHSINDTITVDEQTFQLGKVER